MFAGLPFVGLNTILADESVLKASLDAGSAYVGTDGPGGNPAGFCTLTIKTDGTWTITAGADDILSGTPTSGYWILGGAPIAGIGTTHEVIFSHTGVTGTGTISNGASSYSALTADRTFTFTATLGQNGLTQCTPTIRKIGTTTPVCTETIQIGATGA